MTHSRFHDLNLSNATLIFADILVLFSIFSFGLIGIEHFTSTKLPQYGDTHFFIHLVLYTLPLQIALLAVGLYNEKLRESFNGMAVRLLVALVLAYILSSGIYFITPLDTLPNFSRELIFSLTFIGLLISRFIAITNNYEKIGQVKVLVIGAGERASLIERCMRRKSDRVHFDLQGYVHISGDNKEQAPKGNIIELDCSLSDYVKQHNIEEIVIAADERRGNLPVDSLFNCKIDGVLITDIIDFIERETGQIAVTHIYPSWVIFNDKKPSHFFVKALNWLFNSTIALLILLFCWPLIILAIILIKLEDGISAPVLYSQQRTGLRGKPFQIYKFRSMRLDAEKNGAQWATEADPRITKIGLFLRKYRIDELPQLFNVFRGDMCFVGPRPERPQFAEQFEHSIPYYNHRHNVKPGLTGWAQLKYPYGSSKEDAIEKLKFDLYYIKHRSFMLDILILIRTSEIVLFGKGR
ncbi:sugar transferase [Photobacterium jeanii]|uniref:Sugar transferase n=1 Tax=Photobacterium jeanii TaxID=858640 RepID=A0A178K236_9GAMM|nr:TIGR03013 family XrtA/PEP-CTERM system glycosyltransferase [Photobacterium jeanii]OAN11370.1 sugar transferase [Photobacterium jeanii]PST90890.1 sugar transferase [Photobacterium jeanii]